MSELVAQFREYARLERKRTGVGLTPSELRRWQRLKRSLGRRFSPRLSDERADERGSIRVPTRLHVTFASPGQLRRCWMTNLSRGGVFVATDELADIGTRFELRLEIRETGDELVLPCEVVSHNVGPGFERQSRGMGMRFLELSEEVKKQLDELYEGALLNAADASTRTDS